MRQHIEGTGTIGGVEAHIQLVHDRPADGLASWSGSATPAPGHSFDLTGDLIAVRVVDGQGREFSGQALVTNHRVGSGGESADLQGSGPLNGG